MSKMVERVARALAANGGYDPDHVSADPLQETYPDWHKYIPDARAAITAMLEPTEAILSAGEAAMLFEGAHDCEVPIYKIYNDMIAEALK